MNTKLHRSISGLLLVIALFNFVSCAAGAGGLAGAGPELFGNDILAGTVFSDRYWLVACLLGFVGLTQLTAVIAHLKRWPLLGTAHAFAGMTMMVFLFVEVLMIDEYFLLQPLFFAVGALQLSLSPLIRRAPHEAMEVS